METIMDIINSLPIWVWCLIGVYVVSIVVMICALITSPMDPTEEQENNTKSKSVRCKKIAC